MALSFSVAAGCGDKTTGKGQTNVTESTKASEAVTESTTSSVNLETEASTETSAVVSNEYYTVDANGKYTFETSKFDPDKYSQTIYVNGIEFALPLQYSELLENGIYAKIDEKNEYTEEGFVQMLSQTTIKPDDLRWDYGFSIYEDGVNKALEGFYGVTMYNPSDAVLPCSECQFGWIISDSGEASRKIFGIPGNDSLTLDEIMKNFGAPAAASQVSSGNTLLYPYEGGILQFDVDKEGNVEAVGVLTWEYGLSVNYIRDDIPSQYIPEAFQKECSGSFVIEGTFNLSTRGLTCTGTVETGVLSVGDTVIIQFSDGTEEENVIAGLEVYGDANVQSFSEGEKGGMWFQYEVTGKVAAGCYVYGYAE